MSSSSKKLGDKPQLMRVAGSMPWLKPREREYYKAKVFKSGNSLAVRLPAGVKLEPGTEMDLTVEDGVHLSLDPVEAPKRKFNIAKVAGSARNLQYIRPEDRVFEDRPLRRPELSKNEP
jgi:antitoxin VapB